MQALVASRLAALGARRLADTFCFPVSRGATTFAYTSTVREVEWRANTALFYFRSSAIPFNLHSLRPYDARREGVAFSIGAGIVASEPEELTDALVLVQVEGRPPAAVVALGDVEEALRPCARPLERSESYDEVHDWQTFLLSAVAEGEG